MKTILLPTNFSGTARHAAEYAYSLAKQLKADIILCHAETVHAEIPMSGMVAWPLMDTDELIDASTAELQRLKAHLEQNDHTATFRPGISYINEDGKLTDVVNEVLDKQDIDLVIISKHEGGSLSRFLLTDHCRNLIDTTTKPLLIVPPKAKAGKIKKIAFATDFNHIGIASKSIFKLIPFATALNADILLTHIDKEQVYTPEFQRLIDQLMTEISNKADYPHIYYRAVKNNNTVNGLDWLCEHGQIDMLAMTHGPYSFINDILNLSHTQKMAAHIKLPLLVYRHNLLI